MSFEYGYLFRVNSIHRLTQPVLLPLTYLDSHRESLSNPVEPVAFSPRVAFGTYLYRVHLAEWKSAASSTNWVARESAHM